MKKFTHMFSNLSLFSKILTITLSINTLISISAKAQTSDLITNISSATGRAYVLGQLSVGSTFYSDRTYQTTSVPNVLTNAPFIKTPNDDKTSKATTVVTFTLSKNATVYIAYDPRATALPTWMNGWEKLTLQLGIVDPNIKYLQLYSKVFPAGQVNLGGNMNSPAAGALSNYVVMAQPTELATYTLSTNTIGSGSVGKSPDQAAYVSGTKVTLTPIPAFGFKFDGWGGDTSGSNSPITVTMDRNKSFTANFSQTQTSNLITNISSTTGRSYTLAQLVVGSTIYTDRTTHKITSVPAPLVDAPFIKTPNDDKANKATTLISFDLTKDATLYVAYDPRAIVLPAWLNDWEKLSSTQLGIFDPNISYLQLYSKNFPAGKISLGGTLASPASGAQSNYIVIAQPSEPLTKSIVFNQASETAEVEQGSIQSLSEFIVTSDNIPATVKLVASDESGNTPTWLTVNGSILNGLSYTTGSEISFDFDATNLSIGKYSTVIKATSAGYNTATLNILLTVKSATEATLSNLKVNFQDAATIPPSGWLRDYGQAFGARTSAYQGSGYNYGWLRKSDNTPLDLTRNGRLRTSPSDILQATLIHMQANDIANFSGTRVEGIWEAEVVNGNYDVTVSVGDGTETNSTHAINIEGVKAISGFVPTSAVRFKSVTIPVSVADGFLTIDATGGTNTKINYLAIQPSASKRPSVIAINPENSSVNISEKASVSTSILRLPNGGINNATITPANVYLTEETTGAIVPSNVNGTGGGDAITLVPSNPLKLNTTYYFNITDGVKDLSGASFIPYTSSFTTGAGSTSNILNAKFDKVVLTNAKGRHSSLTVGPDGKLYALTIDGIIKRFTINSDGTLGDPQLIYSLQDASGTRTPRLAIGLTFDPSSTANNLIAWVTHSTYLFLNAPDWDGKLSKLTGTNLETVQDVLINLPRSAKDHVTNSIAFGPDNALYFTQGSTSAMGRADQTWNYRNEHLLNAAVLRLDLSKLGTLPLNVKTSDGGGTYSPYAPNAPLTIYASGVRNAYDLVWHSNGSLYTPTNGSAAGANTPASVNGTLRTDGSTYNGPSVPALSNVQQTQKDFLFRIQKGGYYGHPNPIRGEYVMNGGNPTSVIDPAQVNAYPVGTMPDVNWRGYSFDFQNNASPNGAIEYQSNTFNGALKGKLLVVRYSQHDDIITLTPGGADNDIISSLEGTEIQGFSGFIDPLDLTENISTGNLYVSEYGGEGGIVLLRVDSLANSTNSTTATNAANARVVSNPAATKSITNKVVAIRNKTSDSALFSMEETYRVRNDFERAKLFPIPLHDKFTIRFPTSYKGVYEISITDAGGRSYLIGRTTLKAGGSDMKVDISTLSLKSGIYYLNIFSDTARKNEIIKLLIQ